MERLRRLGLLAVHAVAIWALLAATVAVGTRVTSTFRALVVHAVAAPFFTAVVMAVYHAAFGRGRAGPALGVALGVALCDLALAPWLSRATTPMERALETWVPWALVFVQALASGIVAERRRRTVTPGEVTIERAGAADLEGIVALLASLGLPAADLSSGATHLWVARRRGRLAGCVGLEPHGTAGLLRSLAVVPEERGRGLGRALSDRAIEEARALGLRDLYLLTTTIEPLLARWGFETVGRDETPEAVRASPEFASLCPASATCMALRLQ